ncbi:MAG: GH15 family glucan-1,4-alpha-glucosidase [Lentimonas sp.]|jgi:GH15 family glucan-1,4-alpha-glucosidase
MASAQDPLQWILNNRHSPLEISEKFVHSWGQDLSDVSRWRGMDFMNPYDQAVCTMALLSENKIEEAKEILTGLRAVQNPDGSFYFFYDIYRPLGSYVPHKKKFSAMASWTTMAVSYYTYITKDTQFLDMAIKAMDFVHTLQDTDGAIRTNPDVTHKSTEHALNAYSAWSYLSDNLYRSNYKLAKAKKFAACANKIRSYLEDEAWIEEEGRFMRGKAPDNYQVLDVNTWGVLSLGHKSLDTVKDFSRSLDYIEKYYKHTINGITGFDFNLDHESDYTENPSFASGGTRIGSDGLDTVWSEGTLGAVLAFYEVGNTEKAEFYLKEVDKMIYTGSKSSAKGGVLYTVVRGSTSEFAADGVIYPRLDGEDDTESGLPATQACCAGWYILAKNKLNPFKPYKINDDLDAISLP